jgi:hypothetical protein
MGAPDRGVLVFAGASPGAGGNGEKVIRLMGVVCLVSHHRMSKQT